MEKDYREYVVYIDDERFEYHIEKKLEPTTNEEWYDFIDDNVISKEERDLLLSSKHIKVYAVLPSVGAGLLVTEFDTDEVFKEGNKAIREAIIQKGPGYGIKYHHEYDIVLDDEEEEENNEEGVKYDDGKPLAGDMIMIFPHALMGVAKCIEWGSHKYPQTDNYIRLKNGYKRYMNGIMRHLLKMMLGQQYDDETKLPHIYHVCWNALAICEHWFKNQTEEEKEKLMEGLLMPITLEEEP